MDEFDYDKAEADLYDVGCPDSEEIYGYTSEKGFREFMRENGLNPDNYSKNGNSGGNDNSGGCFLTSACMTARGLADDCEELRVLRRYRDSVLKYRDGGLEDIEHYYQVAPKIVEAINGQPSPAEEWDRLYREMVLPCVEKIKAGKTEDAYALYKDTVSWLENEYIN